MGEKADGIIKRVSVVIPTDAGNIYAAGDAIHSGIITLPNILQGHRGSGIIKSITVTDKIKQSASLTLFFFSQTPTTTLPVANAALDITVADMPYLLGYVDLPASAGSMHTTYKTLGTISVVNVTNIDLGLKRESDAVMTRDLYMVAMTNGTPTYTGAADLRATILFAQD